MEYVSGQYEVSKKKRDNGWTAKPIALSIRASSIRNFGNLYAKFNIKFSMSFLTKEKHREETRTHKQSNLKM